MTPTPISKTEWPTTYGSRAHPPTTTAQMEHFGTWADFTAKVATLLEPTAASKGYSTTGLDGKNALYEFVAEMVGGPGHALGEITYKAKRYAARGNPEDLLKIAAWSYLAWRHHKAK